MRTSNQVQVSLWLTTAALMLAGCSASSSTTDSASQSLEVGTNASILGFEDSSQWTPTSGTLTLSENHVEGDHGIGVTGGGYHLLASDPLTTLNQVSNVISYQLFIPAEPTSADWWGQTQLLIEAPSLGLHNRFIGSVELAGKELGAFNRIEYPLPTDIVAALSGNTYEDLVVKVVLNVSEGSGEYVFDAFTFAPCSGCEIEGTCVADGALNPENPCEVCDIADPFEWSPLDGTACDDGLFCNGADTCEAGACSLHTGSPCEEGETCDEGTNQCFVSCTTHVDGVDGDDANDGSSWATALESLETAIERAAQERCQVWVKEGTYRPSGDRSTSFELLEGVALYGGFAGNELDLGERDPVNHVTVLSGDIGIEGDPSDNAYHVLIGAPRSRVDGFVVTGGNADGAGSDGQGGGLYAFGVTNDPTIVGCTFESNHAINGGAVYVYGGAPRVASTTFTHNTASDAGGAVFVGRFSADPEFTACTFSDNFAEGFGGAIRNSYGSVTLTESTLTDNTGQRGGAVDSEGGELTLAACEVADNIAAPNGTSFGFGGGLYTGSVTSIEGGTFVGNRGTRGGGIACMGDCTLTGSNVVVAENAAVWVSEFTGGVGGGLYIDGVATLVSAAVYDNDAERDGGGLYVYYGELGLSASTVSHNRAALGGGLYASGSPVGVSDSIVWYNTTPSITANTITVTTTHVEGGFPGYGNHDVAPGFVNADPNNGPLDLTLTAFSSCIDQASPAAPATDLLGQARYNVVSIPNTYGSYADRGAYEYRP